MSVISAYIINKAGGLIFSHDQPTHSPEVEAVFTYPVGGLVLEEVDRNVMVKFGELQGIQGNWRAEYLLVSVPPLYFLFWKFKISYAYCSRPIAWAHNTSLCVGFVISLVPSWKWPQCQLCSLVMQCCHSKYDRGEGACPHRHRVGGAMGGALISRQCVFPPYVSCLRPL